MLSKAKERAKSVLSQGDAKRIAEKAGIAQTTVGKWKTRSMSVHRSTEVKIIESWMDVIEEDIMSADSEIKRLDSVIDRANDAKSKIQDYRTSLRDAGTSLENWVESQTVD